MHLNPRGRIISALSLSRHSHPPTRPSANATAPRALRADRTPRDPRASRQHQWFEAFGRLGASGVTTVVELSFAVFAVDGCLWGLAVYVVQECGVVGAARHGAGVLGAQDGVEDRDTSLVQRLSVNVPAVGMQHGGK